MTQRLSDAELALLEQFGGSAAPQLVPSSRIALEGERVTDAFGNPPGAAADGQLGQVGGVRRRRATRRHRRRQQRRTRGRNRLVMNMRLRIRARSRHT